eukprot:COSAG04_NODE_3255_length_3004_cov_2.042341_5_plen_91_part_01
MTTSFHKEEYEKYKQEQEEYKQAVDAAAQGGKEQMNEVVASIRSDMRGCKDYMITMVAVHPWSIDVASEALQDDEEVILAALQADAVDCLN